MPKREFETSQLHGLSTEIIQAQSVKKVHMKKSVTQGHFQQRGIFLKKKLQSGWVFAHYDLQKKELY